MDRDLDIFSILDDMGRRRDGAPPVELPAERLLELIRAMALVRHIDERLAYLQRQGRIAFALGSTGQEASVIGSAAAVENDDWIFPGNRELGAALLRGWPLDRLLAHAFGSENDVGRGRDLPRVFFDRSVNHVSTSPCTATQLPHAVGAAYAMKLRGDRRVALAYLGDGATSPGDFHAALNFAGVWQVPVVFVCVNNAWALSVPVAKQTASATLAVKARAYGMPGVRVDGNDVLAVHHVTDEAVDRARRGEGPSLIECVTYRVAPFACADDPRRYRSDDEVARWKARDPIERFRRFLVSSNLWNEADQAVRRTALVAEVNEAVRRAERIPRPSLDSMFSDVTKTPSPSLAEQRSWLAGRDS